MRSVGADDRQRHSFADGLIQVGQTGSQSFAQSAVRAGVPAIAAPGQLGHRRPTGGLRRCTIPAGKQRFGGRLIVMLQTLHFLEEKEEVKTALGNLKSQKAVKKLLNKPKLLKYLHILIINT